MCDVAFTNSTSVICQNPKVTAINSCIEVDLSGQVCADSIGERIYSGNYIHIVISRCGPFGGQVGSSNQFLYYVDFTGQVCADSYGERTY